jgi:hypothetical protein
MAASVAWIALALDESPLFECIQECNHIGAIDCQCLGQVLLGSLVDSFKQQQNPIMGGMQFPGAKNLRKLATSLAPQSTQQIRLVGEQVLR